MGWMLWPVREKNRGREGERQRDSRKVSLIVNHLLFAASLLAIFGLKRFLAEGVVCKAFTVSCILSDELWTIVRSLFRWLAV